MPASDVLDEQPVLRRTSSTRALSELVAHERTRQDARFAALRRLGGNSDALGEEALAPKRNLRSLIGAAFRRRQQDAATDEAALRARYEQAQVRARRASVFAESLSALETELAAELRRLGELLIDLAADERSLDDLLVRVRAATEDADALRASTKDEVVRREAEARLDQGRARVEALDSQRKALRDAEDRLLGLVEGERMLGNRLASLRSDVERAAREATRRLDTVADALRTLVTSSDARRVVSELEGALETLFGSLDESARLQRDAQRALDDTEKRRGDA